MLSVRGVQAFPNSLNEGALVARENRGSTEEKFADKHRSETNIAIFTAQAIMNDWSSLEHGRGVHHYHKRDPDSQERYDRDARPQRVARVILFTLQ